MTNSLSKYIRREKARIRREVLDTQAQQSLIGELYKKYYPKQKDQSEDAQPSVN